MIGWRRIKLKEITTKIGSGSTPKGGEGSYFSTGVSLIRSQNVLDFTFSNSGLVYIDENQAYDLRNVSLEHDDVLVNITGDSVARVCQVPKEIIPARVNQHVAIVRPNKKLLSPAFLKYFLLHPQSKSQLLTLSGSGATRKALTKVMLEDLEIRIPPLSEQQAIAEILSALDDKIELNLQTNKTLEQMANAFYKHWFVDFGPFQGGKFVDSEIGMIPEGWEYTPIGKIKLDISDGNYSSKYPTSDEFISEGVPFIRAVNMKNGILVRNDLKYISKEKHSILTKGHLKKGDILLVTRGNIGEVAKVPSFFVNANINAQLVRINGGEVLPSSYLYLSFSSETFRRKVKASTSGTALQQLPIGTLNLIKLLVPLDHILLDFNCLVADLFMQIEVFSDEIALLKQTRDYLLPKLISGEILVKDAKKKVKELV